MIEYIPGLAGVPATESSISSIDGKNGILAYRGYSIEDLVKYASFEEVAMLLRDGELPSADALYDFKEALHQRYEVKRGIREMMWALPANGHPMDVLQTAIASMATFYLNILFQHKVYIQKSIQWILIFYLQSVTWFMVFNATFYNISVILWYKVLHDRPFPVYIFIYIYGINSKISF
jgi:citrate synthase